MTIFKLVCDLVRGVEHASVVHAVKEPSNLARASICERVAEVNSRMPGLNQFCRLSASQDGPRVKLVVRGDVAEDLIERVYA